MLPRPKNKILFLPAPAFGGGGRVFSVFLVGLLLAWAPASAQDTANAALGRGYDLEQKGQWSAAAESYRQALRTGRPEAAVLGLERVYTEMGRIDSLVPLLDSAIAAWPRDPILRSAQLRVYRSLLRPSDVRAAFERWVRDVPHDATPYREYAQLLLEQGQAAAADSVLDRAERALGSGRELVLETAQLKATLGLWEPAARAWRTALDTAGDIAAAAAYSLRATPDSMRPAVRMVLMAPPVSLGSRRAMADLELAWGSARAGWAALADLRPDSGAVEEWEQFAEAAEGAGDWLVARDAYAAVLTARPGSNAHAADLAARAASAAMHGGDAVSALAMADRVGKGMDSALVARTVLPVRVQALASLGRSADAEHAERAYGHWLDASGRATLTREIAWGYVRAGDIARARAAVGSSAVADDEELGGWLALYAGDLKGARAALRQAAAPSADLVTALAFLARTHADSAPAAGQAFVMLARGDTTGAAKAFVEASDLVHDAAPLLLAIAARLHEQRHDDGGAVPIWRTVVERYSDAPEAAEADLEWGRALKRERDVAGATARWEHLILTYPESALVPQARRELESARQSAPQTS
jgi:tetratricopeptide (TPR) repeat protein